MERTGKINQFTSSLIPAFLFRRRIKRELDEISQILNVSKDEGNEELIWEIQSLAKINAIEASYLGVLNILELSTKVRSFTAFMIRRDRRKIKDKSDSLPNYIANISKYADINIETMSDLEKVRKNLEFRKDKFNENFSKKPKGEKSDKMFLMAIALGVFSYLNQPINVDMTIVDFAVLREEAVKRIEREKAKK